MNTEDKLDFIIKHCPSHKPFNLGELCRYYEIEMDSMKEIASISKMVRLTYNYAEETGVHTIQLNENGRDAQRFGGHILYQKKLTEEKTSAKEVIDLDIKSKRFLYKYRIVPYIFSGLAFATACISIYISMKALKNSKAQEVIPEMKEKKQQQILQKNVPFVLPEKKIDSTPKNVKKP